MNDIKYWVEQCRLFVGYGMSLDQALFAIIDSPTFQAANLSSEDFLDALVASAD